MSNTLRVAIVHDWLVTWAGAEKALAELLALFPQAELFTLVNFLDTDAQPALKGRIIHTSFIQRLPSARKRYRQYLPLMPLAVEQFDLKGFDLILSSSHAVAKGVIPDPQAVHVCYCYSPMRYAWDMQHQYLRETGNARGLKSMLMRWQLHRLRQWDFLSAQRVDHFIAISKYIERRIECCYRRKSSVVYPPVATEQVRHDRKREAFYLTAGRFVPYKRFDLVIQAFAEQPDKHLIVIGDGPERARLEAMAGPNVTLLGYQPDSVLLDHLERAQAFLYMAEEDFGILPVEAQAAGAPVIGYGVGGMAETVQDGVSGLHVMEQSVAALEAKLKEFERRQGQEATRITAQACRTSAERFDRNLFRTRLMATISESLPHSAGVAPSMSAASSASADLSQS